MDINFRISYFLYIVSLLFAPLAFGATEEWSFLIVLILLGISFLFYMIYAGKNKTVLYRVPGTAFFGAGLVYVILQIVSFPGFLLKLVSGKSYQINKEVLGSDFSNILSTVSLNFEGGLITLSQLTAFFVVYYLSVQFFSRYKILKKTLFITAVFAGVLSISTILQSVFTQDMALWFRYVPENSMVFGPYVNHNHYAGLMEMLLPLVFALYLIYKPSLADRSLREKILGFLGRESAYIYIMYIFFAALIMLSVFMSLSRAGIFSMIVSLAFFALFTKQFRKNSKTGYSLIVFGFILLGCLTWYGWSNLDLRFGRTIEQMENNGISRLNFWQDTFEIIKDFPLTGSGGGSFEQVYPMYKSYVSDRIIGHAHNDYLELLSDFGILGFIIVSGFLFSVIYKGFKNLRKRKERYAVLGASAAFSGLLAIGFHSITDFNMQIPANLLIFAFVLGLFISLSHTRFRKNLEPTYLMKTRVNSKIFHSLIFLLFWIPSVIYSAGASGGRISSFELPDKEVTPGISSSELEKYSKAAEKAFNKNPYNYSFAEAVGDSFFFRGDFGSAVDYYRKSLNLSPVSGDIIQKYGIALNYSGNDLKGKKLLKIATKYNPENILLSQRLAGYYFDKNMKKKGLDIIADTLKKDPSQTRDFLNLMWTAGLNFTDMERSLPYNSEALYRYAGFVKNLKFKLDSGYYEAILEKAVDAARDESEPYKNVYISLARNYLNKNQADDAMDILYEGLEKYPDDRSMLYYAGRASEKLSLYFKAEEYYQQALTLDPDFKSASERLERLREN